jgi:hypothetical protein
MKNLPILQAYRHALDAVISFRAVGIRIALPWVIIITLLTLVQHFVQGPPGNPANLDPPTLAGTLIDIAIAALDILAVSSIAVNWHRYILRDEFPITQQILRLDRPVWRYAGTTILISLIVVLPLVLISLMASNAGPAILALLVLPLLFSIIYMLRMMLALPAVALDRKDFGLADALKATQGTNFTFLAIVAINTILMLLVLLSFGIIMRVFFDPATTVGAIAISLLGIPVQIFITLFTLSLLSSLYGFYVENRKF